jgi:ketosteroid isomerase-like protein
MSTIFARAEDVENAFYEAIARADLDALMAVWADDEEIICIHPTGQRLLGATAIRDNWRNIFAHNPRLSVRISHSVRWSGMLIAVHSVVETLYVGNENTAHGPMLATNVFQRGARGWRLLSHHSSTAASVEEIDQAAAAQAGESGSGQRTLH